MFCHKCGAQIAEGAAFCHKCGAKVVYTDTVQQSVDTSTPTIEPQTEITQHSASAPINTSGKKKPKLPIIPIVAAFAIVLIILAVIGSNVGSSTSDDPLPDNTDAASSETPDKSEPPDNSIEHSTTGEILYAGIPVSQLIGAFPDEVIEALGNPDHMSAMYLEYKDIYVTLSGNDNTVTEISGNAQLFTINDQTMDKGYDEIVQMLGEPDSETDTRYSNVLEYNTVSYQMFIYVDWEENRANSINFNLPLGNEGDGEDDWIPPGDIDDPGTLIRDTSLVGRWRSYDGGYVEFGDYGEAAVSSSLTTYGNIGKPDYVTWEAYNGRIILSSHYSTTSTYELKDYGTHQFFILTGILDQYYWRNTEMSSSLVGSWVYVGDGYTSTDALVLSSDGTGTMEMWASTSSTSLDMVPISWWADDKNFNRSWTVQTAYDYAVSGDMLTIYFSNGSQIYSRVGN